MEIIKIQVDSEVAQAYRAANPQQQETIGTILKLFFQPDFVEKSLSQVMEDIADRAQQRGLTPEILESILHDD